MAPDFTLWHSFTLAVILFAAGMMSGLTGFAFSALAALFLLAPITGVPLLQALSACNQMLSVGKKEMPRTFAQWWPKGPGPAILGGLIAVPAIGGFTAFPGLTVVIWTGIRGLSKVTGGAIVQPFILTLQIVSLTTNALQHPKNFGVSFGQCSL